MIQHVFLHLSPLPVLPQSDGVSNHGLAQIPPSVQRVQLKVLSNGFEEERINGIMVSQNGKKRK